MVSRILSKILLSQVKTIYLVICYKAKIKNY